MRRAVLLSVVLLLAAQAAAQQMSVWVKKNFSSWDNPLQGELSVNGETVNVFTSDTADPIQLKNGWNTIVVKTTLQVANKGNGLQFRIGPMMEGKKKGDQVMNPVLWRFHNYTDWSFDNQGQGSHPLGPKVTEVTQTYKLYYAGMDRESGELKAGDYVLMAKANYNSWDTPVTATVAINGTMLNSFTIEGRQIIITDLLKPGKNEIKLISTRVPNAIKDNDVIFQIAGPAEWVVTEKKYVVKPLLKFTAKQGWTQDPKSGQLMNRTNPKSDDIERVIPFLMKTAAAGTTGTN